MADEKRIIFSGTMHGPAVEHLGVVALDSLSRAVAPVSD